MALRDELLPVGLQGPQVWLLGEGEVGAKLFAVPWRQRKTRRKAELFCKGPGPRPLEVAEMGNGLVWNRVVGGKRRCKEGCEEKKSWGLGCSEHVGADGMAGGRFPQEGKGPGCL